MKAPRPGGNDDAWTWIAFWVVSLVCAAGAGIGLQEGINNRDKKERDNKWRELLQQERDKNTRLQGWVEKMEARCGHHDNQKGDKQL